RTGAKAYRERLTGSQPYLDFLLERASAGRDLNRPDQRRVFLNQMLTVAATIPDAASRDQFADRLAHKARITESVVRDEIRRAAAGRRTEAPAIAVAGTTRLLPHEQGLLWTLEHRPVEGLAAVSRIDAEDLDGLLSAPVLLLAASLSDVPPGLLPGLLRDRMSPGERELFERAARADAPAAEPTACLNALKRDRVRREIALIQREVDQLQEGARMDDAALTALWQRKKTLLERLEDLNQGNA